MRSLDEFDFELSVIYLCAAGCVCGSAAGWVKLFIEFVFNYEFLTYDLRGHILSPSIQNVER